MGWQFGLLFVLSLLFIFLDLDRTIAGVFYNPDVGWIIGHHPFWEWLYHYGTLPGVLLTLFCLIAWMVTFFRQRFQSWRPYFLLVVLTTAISAGLLVNTVLKPYWGRPRPNQITEFGGYYKYRHVLQPGIPGKGSSFPSGHSAMGFVFLTLAFFARRSKKIAYTGIGAGLILGALVSAQRMVRGAHFSTDILWSMGIVLITATLLYYWVLKIPARKRITAKPVLRIGQKFGLVIVVIIAVALIGGAFMTRRPFYKTREFHIPAKYQADRWILRINTEPEHFTVRVGDVNTAVVLVHAHGFGWAYVDYSIDADFLAIGETLEIDLEVIARSYFAELDHAIEVILPSEKKNRIKIELETSDQKQRTKGSG